MYGHVYERDTDKRKGQEERETENWHLKHMTAGEESQKIWRKANNK